MIVKSLTRVAVVALGMSSGMVCAAPSGLEQEYTHLEEAFSSKRMTAQGVLEQLRNSAAFNAFNSPFKTETQRLEMCVQQKIDRELAQLAGRSYDSVVSELSTSAVRDEYRYRNARALFERADALSHQGSVVALREAKIEQDAVFARQQRWDLFGIQRSAVRALAAKVLFFSILQGRLLR